MEKAGNALPGLKDFAAALRLPFISVSILAFVFGSFISSKNFSFFAFSLGLAAAITTHLGANLFNDYADSISGADWQDLKPYKFFGGSKFIQAGILSEGFYLRAAISCFSIALVSVVALAWLIHKPITILFYLLIMFLGWAYSCKPLELSYHRMGEPVIFLLFGPALVMGGYFIQTGIFPGLKSFLLSLPFGFLTLAILFANEIPDHASDKKSGKANWVSFLGAEKSYLIYIVLMAGAFLAIALNIRLGFLQNTAYFSLLCIFPAIKAVGILKKHYSDKGRLVASSKLTILAHNLVSLVLILAVYFRTG